MLRADDEACALPLARLCRVMNLFMPGPGHHVAMPPHNNVCYRGTGWRNEHRAFFAEGKQYRQPMFLATSINREQVRDFMDRAHGDANEHALLPS